LILNFLLKETFRIYYPTLLPFSYSFTTLCFCTKDKNKEEVFDEILEEYFKGGTKTARLVEKTFGKVGFRALGMMGGSDEAGGVASTLELLQSLRAAELSRGRKSEKTAKK